MQTVETKKLLKSLTALMVTIVITGVSAFGLSSCGNDGKTSEKKNISSQATSSEYVDDNVEDDSETELESLGDFNTNPTIEKTVLVDNKRVTITATGLDYTNYAAVITINIKNKTNKGLQVSSGTAGYSANSVNRYMISAYMNCDVPKNKSVEKEMKLSFTDLNIYGITEIAEIKLAFTLMDDNYDDKEFTEPALIKTSIYDSYDYNSNSFIKAVNSLAIRDGFGVTVKKSFDSVIFDKKGIRLITEVYAANKDNEAALLLEFVNDTEKQYTLELYDLVINGKTIEESYLDYSTINAKERAVADITFDSDSLEESKLNFDSIETIVFSISVRDKDYNYLIDDEEISVQV